MILLTPVSIPYETVDILALGEPPSLFNEPYENFSNPRSKNDFFKTIRYCVQKGRIHRNGLP